jgi:hypothetical protein
MHVIEVAMPGERNLIKKEDEKILNTEWPKKCVYSLLFILHVKVCIHFWATLYKDLIKEIQRMWNVKAKVTSVITGATGTISKSP